MEIYHADGTVTQCTHESAAGSEHIVRLAYSQGNHYDSGKLCSIQLGTLAYADVLQYPVRTWRSCQRKTLWERVKKMLR